MSALATAAAEEVLSPRDFRRISDLVYRHCGINLHEGKEQLVRARVSKRMRDCGFRSPRTYLDHVLADKTGGEFHHLIDALSTNLTHFFRESGHFDHLSREFLPAMAQRKIERGSSRVRAWSAGCSTGEEPYSLGMTLMEALGEERHWNIRVLATDISTRVLDVAETGIYDAQRLEEVSPAWRLRYFEPVPQAGAAAGRVGGLLRSLIRFNYLNLMTAWPFSGPFDFIFCRNVMIYFDKPTQQDLVGRFWRCLSPGGLLFTGHSESLTGISHPFHYVRPTIYMKQ